MSSCAYVFTRGVACGLHFELEIVGGATEYDGPGENFVTDIVSQWILRRDSDNP